jgi:hypothetical protein
MKFTVLSNEIDRQHLQKQEKQQVEMPANKKKNVPQGALF